MFLRSMMEFDINKSQLSELGKLQQPMEINMTKEEVIKELRKTKTISTEMLKVLGMSFDVWLQYAQLSEDRKQNVINKAFKKLGVSTTFCDACECDPCDCGYGSY